MDHESNTKSGAESSIDASEQNFDGDITVADVISCFIALRSAAPERIIELCDLLNHDHSISVNELKNIIQQFAVVERNSISSDCDAKFSDDSRFLNTTGNLEGCGGDVSVISIVEHDVGELLLRNKSISHNNFNLRRENVDLRKQLEICYEESDAQRQKISDLEKDLKQIHGNKSDIQELLTEKDEVQSQNLKLQEEIRNHLNREKIIKEETEDYRKTLSDLQDKYDNLLCQLDDEKMKRDNVQDDLDLIQVKYEDCQYRAEKDKETSSMQAKQIAELQEKISQYDYECEALKEENNVLSEQLREYKLEISICDRELTETGPDLMKSSIDYELNSADKNLHNNPSLSPLCGTSVRKNGRGNNEFSFTEVIKNNMFAFKSAPSSPKRLFEVCLGNDVLPRLLKFASHDNEMRTAEVKKCDSASQTEDLQRQDDSPAREGGDDYKQGLSSIYEENEAFIATSSKIQDDLCHKNAEILGLKTTIDTLQTDLDTERNSSEHWKDLAMKYRCDLEILRKDLDAEQNNVLCLSEMNSKLCSSQLDTWWGRCVKRFNRFGKKSEDKGEHSLNKWSPSSRLIESLCLVRDFPKTIDTDFEIQLHGQELTVNGLRENEETAVHELIEFCDIDVASYHARMNVLKICQSLTSEALSKKCGHFLKFIDQCQCSCVDISSNLTIRDFARTTLGSIQVLSSKTCELEKYIGAREEEMKLRDIIEVMKHLAKSCQEKHELRRAKLAGLTNFTTKPCSVTEQIISPVLDMNNDECLPATYDALGTESDVDDLFEQLFESKISKWQKLLFGTGFTTWLTILGFPSKYRLMIILFLLCVAMTFRPCDYKVPLVI